VNIPEHLAAALADRYRLERVLGHGGMATVYLAEDLKHHRKVAVKVLKPELAAVLGAERFLKEIEVTASLQHPGILPLFDSGRAGGQTDGRTEDFLFYVMPFVEGESLRDRLTREKQLAVTDAVRIATEVASALDYAHRQGVIHRDIKPENIMLHEGRALLADFGIALAVSEAGGARLTETGMSVGTPHYMSPEQATGERVLDARSDLYGLAAVLYEMLTGEPPHSGPTARAVVAKLMTAEPVAVGVLRPGVPAAVEQAVTRALAKVPSDRFATLAQFAAALESERAGAAIPAAGAVAWRRRHSTVVVAAAAVTVAAAVTALVWHRPLVLTTSNSRQVTSEPGIEYQPALSPDGSQVAFIARGAVVIRRIVATPGAGEVVAHRGGSFPAWSPDGESVRFWGGAGYREVGPLGGAASGVELPRQTPWAAWSRDGTRAALIAQDSIFVYSLKGESTRFLVAPRNRGDGLHSPAWSPDGRWIAYVAGNPFWTLAPNTNSSAIWIVASDGGQPVPVATQGLNVSPVWLDNRHLMFVSDRDGQREIYALEVTGSGPRGQPLKIPGGTDAHSISLSADGRRLAFAKFTARQNVREYPLDPPEPVPLGSGRLVTSGNQRVETQDVSPDGEWLLYDSDIGTPGGSRIYRVPISGGTPIAVTSGGQAPRWSPDGREVTFLDGGLKLAPIEGGTPVTLPTPDSGYSNAPVWSPDGLRLAFWSDVTGRVETWLMSRERVGAPWQKAVQVTHFGCFPTQWAPDGSGFYCAHEARGEPGGFMLLSLSGKVLWHLDSALVDAYRQPLLSRDGSTFYAGVAGKGVFAWPRAGGKPRQVVKLDGTGRPNFWMGAYTIGPKGIYFTVDDSESDIWVMDLKR
jgi:serine/threonine-protein kinase